MKGIGMLLAVVAVAIAAAVAVLVAIRPDDHNILELELGDCFDVPLGPGESDLRSVDTVDCDRPHEAEVVATGQLDPDGRRPYPGDDDLFAEVDARCRELVPDLDPAFGLLPIAPNEASWEPLGGRFLCVAIPYGGGTVTGSA